MAKYACFCTGCNTFQFSPWGVRECPACGGRLIQSRVEQWEFESMTTEKKYTTFLPLVKEDSPEYKLLLAGTESHEKVRYLQQKMYEDELSKEEARKHAFAEMTIALESSFEDAKIVKRGGYIFADAVSTLPRSVSFESESGQNQLTDAIAEARNKALEELKEEAFELGCNAIISLDFDYLTLDWERYPSFDKSVHIKEDYVICVSAKATAVVLEKI